jgi:hypothetical protein
MADTVTVLVARETLVRVVNFVETVVTGFNVTVVEMRLV